MRFYWLSGLFALLIFSPAITLANPEQFMAAHGRFIKLFQPGFTPLNLTYQYSPEREPDTSGGRESQFDEHVFEVALNHPIPMSRDFALTPGGTYGARLLDFDNVRPSIGDDSETLHQLEGRLAASYFTADDFMVSALMRVGAFGNFDGGVSSDDVQVLGSLMGVYQQDNRLQWVFGAAVTEDFDDTAFIPLLGLRHVSGDWHFDLTFPQRARATYTVDDRLSLYVGGFIAGTQYRVEGANNQEFDIQIRDQRIGVGTHYWLTRALRLTIEGGALIGKDAYEFKVDGQSGETEEDLKNSGYIRASLGIRY